MMSMDDKKKKKAGFMVAMALKPKDDDKEPEGFDEVVFACHGDQVLPLLAEPSPAERDIFSKFTTSRNVACLHTDDALLPVRADARASWNYMLSGDAAPGASLTYHMNRLQSLPGPVNYCVTLNATSYVDATKILRTQVFHHPVYNAAAIQAQSRWAEISGRNHSHFCGAYWFYGFHEDGLNSGLRVARALGVNV
jgi:predicted NAD/FAD-binding protein